MASHKRNVKKLVILERRKNVAKRYLRGETQWEIARAFEVDQATVSTDLKAIQKEWLAQALLDRGEWTARELARIDEVERNAWVAWTKSQENAEVLRAKMKGQASETEKISKGQAGDPRFLEIVLKCVAKRCELLGLDAEKDPDKNDANRNGIPATESLRQLPLDELVRLHRASLGLPATH